MGKKNLLNMMVSSGLIDEYKITIPISSLKDHGIKTAVVDASNYIHRYGPSNLCGGFIELNKTFNNHGCVLNFVFDGKPPKEKQIILEERKKRRNKNKTIVGKYEGKLMFFKEQLSLQTTTHNEKIEIKTQMTEVTANIKKYKKRSFSIKKEHITVLKNLFDYLKIPYIHLHNYEADLVCSRLVGMKHADACLSDDYDLISYNCKCILRNLDMKNGTVDIIKLDELYSKINLNYEEFIYLIIMNGSDYSEKAISYSEKVRDYSEKAKDITDIYRLFIEGYDIIEVLLLINNPKYKYQKAYNIFTQQIDINPEIDIINYKHINLIYRTINTDNTLFITQLNKYISDTGDKVGIDNINKKINEYVSLFSYNNPYLCL
jgi:5'-3' exonuclease